MPDKNYFDFDKLIVESNAPIREMPRVKIGGQEFELPAELPASVGLIIARHYDAIKDSNNVPPDIVEPLAVGLLGQDALNAIRGMNPAPTFAHLGKLLMWALEQYTAEDEQGNPDPGT